jgi:hypothetical protein
MNPGISPGFFHAVLLSLCAEVEMEIQCHLPPPCLNWVMDAFIGAHQQAGYN